MQIVAPAGSYNGLIASINGGADAVYLGMPNFGARAKAQNFDEQSLFAAIELAHLHSVKVFVTLNTLIKDAEMKSAIDAAKCAYSAGADAAIVQDIRYIKELKRALPDFALHASTQMGIHNADGAKVLRDLGIARAVLARETLPQDIAEIKKTGIEIEYFVQGALCVCFSGNCYFSSLASSYSGNRGKCMQLCRKPYYFNGSRGYHLSAKDLCLFDKLDMLRDLGVDAIKIEGRMRSDEYAYTAVNAYKNMPGDAKNALKSVFNRGDYCDGYLSDGARFNVIHSKIQGNIGLKVGKITSVNGNNITVNGFLPHKNDGFKVLRDGAEVCGATVKGDKIVSDGKCKAGDELRRTFDGALSERIKTASKRNIDISVDIIIENGSVPIANVMLPNSSVITVCGDFVAEHAKTCGVTADDIERAFKKTSEYPFDPKIKVDIGERLFVPIAALNEFRRKVYKAVKQAILDGYTIKRSTLPYIGLQYNLFTGTGKILMVESSEQLNAEIVSKVDYIVLNPKDYANFSVPNTEKPILLNMPVTMRGDDRDIILKAINRPEIYGVVSNNIYSLGLTDKPILLGVGHNIIGECPYPHVTSFESDVIGNGFAYVFGHAPVMTLCHCPYGKCINCSGKDELKDESGRVFPLRRYKAAHCYWQLLNCVPNYQNKLKTKNMFFDCTYSDQSEILSVLNFEYKGDYTRGNMNKGLK